MIRPVSALRASCTPRRQRADAVHDRRPARPAGLAQAGLDGSGSGWRRDPRLRALVAKGRGYTEDDKRHAPRASSSSCCARVIPAYRAAAAARPGRAVDLAVLSPDPAAAVRHATCIFARTRSRRCRAGCSRWPDDARAADRRARSTARGDCSERAPPGCGRRKDRCRTRSCALLAEPGVAVDRDRRRDPGALARPRPLTADDAVSAVRRRRGRRSRALPVPRSRAVGSDRVRLPVVGCGMRRPTTFVRRVREAGRRFARRRRGSGRRHRDPRRRERVGALRRRRPAVSARALSAARAIAHRHRRPSR